MQSNPYSGDGAVQRQGGTGETGAAAGIEAKGAATGGKEGAARAGKQGAHRPMPGLRDGLTILPELDRMYVALRAKGHHPTIASGFRTIDEQIEKYAHGRTFKEFSDDLAAAVEAGTVTREKATQWTNYYQPPGGHPMPGIPQVTWTFASHHLTGDAADVVDADLKWKASAAFWADLKEAAEAEGLQIGPPADDVAHVQRP